MTEALRKPGLKDLGLILSTIADGVVVVDLRGVVLYANRAAELLLERSNLVGSSLAIPINPAAPRQELNLIRPSGLAWAEFSAAPIEWDGMSGYVLSMTDITERKQAEHALRNSELLFHTLASNAPVGIFRTDAHGAYDYVNERWCEIAGINADAALGQGWLQSILSVDRACVAAAWQSAAETNLPFKLEYRFQRPDGELTWVIAQACAELDASETVVGYVGTVTDITALKVNEDNLRQAAAVVESTREGVMLVDVSLRIIKVNKAFSRITGYAEDEAVGNTPNMLQSGRHSREFYSEMWASINQSGHWQGEVWNRRKSGEIYPELLSISVIKDSAGDISNYVGVFADISKLKASETKLEYLAHHDPLTGLPNRLLLLSRLHHAIESSQRNGKLLAVLMIDLDRFKDVNDSYGHLAGDELLQQVGVRLTSVLREVDTVCRLGGDEFTIVLENVAQPEDAARVANEVICNLNKPWLLSIGNEVRIGASVGISMYPTHGDSPEILLQQADTALYQAKNEGRGRFKYFSEDLTRMARARIELEVRLRRAIEHGELRVYYQPQVSIESGLIVGAEALVRWLDPVFGLIPPVEFISVAEETGLITPIGNWVLKETCRQGAHWMKTGLPDLTLAVNLSPQQFLYSNIDEVVRAAILETGFPAERLELELTESALMQREGEAIEILNRLHALGTRVAIDDFGTGYSSLAYLKLFPLDVLKVDKTFIDDIPMHHDDMEITTAIIAMARALHLKVLAEGVENAEQLAFLKSQGCNFYQGYLFSPPVTAEAFEQRLKAQAE